MNKISILVKNNTFVFSIYKKDINIESLNNTNVIDTQNLKFTENYIISNMDLICSFLNLVIIKYNINKVIIKNLEIAETVLKLIKEISKINEISFVENKDLNYTLSSLLLENTNLTKIDCFNLPYIMLNKFPDGIVNTRCEIVSFSNFMHYNSINNYSKMCNLDKVTVDNYQTEFDSEDMLFFFSKNYTVRTINIKGYTRENLISILKVLNTRKKVTINIYEDDNTINSIIKDIPLFTKLCENYNVNIKVVYSKEYKEKNGIKQLNITLFKIILIILILITIFIFTISKISDLKSSKIVDENMDIINSALEDISNIDEIEENSEDETTEENVEDIEENVEDNSSYVTSYERLYDKLLNINPDTIGWLKVNGTRIDYPIVQKNDNNYYLHHAFNDADNKAGWLFVDYRNDMNEIDRNTIIYGHNLKSGMMFGTLRNTLQDSWNENENNLTIHFSIKGVNYKWQIFSIYTIDKTDDYLITQFSSDASFERYLLREKERSIKNFDVTLSSEDKILTLSTCHKDTIHRLVVHAKLINE